MKLTVLGAGSVRCGIPVFASLATYFGELPLEISLYDADEERLDLFDRFARAAFLANKNGHSIRAGTDWKEMLEGADRVILQLGDNCARKEAKASRSKALATRTERISASLERILGGFESDAAVVSLQTPDVAVPLGHYYRLNWPPAVDEDERRSIPHQVLRWIRGEDYLFEVFKEQDRSPLKLWLDDVTCATVVSEL